MRTLCKTSAWRQAARGSKDPGGELSGLSHAAAEWLLGELPPPIRAHLESMTSRARGLECPSGS